MAIQAHLHHCEHTNRIEDYLILEEWGSHSFNPTPGYTRAWCCLEGSDGGQETRTPAPVQPLPACVTRAGHLAGLFLYLTHECLMRLQWGKGHQVLNKQKSSQKWMLLNTLSITKLNRLYLYHIFQSCTFYSSFHCCDSCSHQFSLVY